MRQSNIQQRRAAFTLIEILVVVILLGILAAIVIPKFSNATETARCSMMADNLRIIRTQIAVFKGQHNGVAPGYPNLDTTQAPTEAAFIAHMTQSSKPTGELAAPGTAGFPYGPYLREAPANSMNEKSSVQMIADGAGFPGAADDSDGWIYQPSTMNFKADCQGSDETGRDYFDY